VILNFDGTPPTTNNAMEEEDGRYSHEGVNFSQQLEA
jgi:hypothetical protein